MGSQPRETLPDDQTLQACQQRLGYVFRNTQLLRAALTHASSAQHRLASNERLEFLGDAILGAVVCEVLYHEYPHYLEGDLTKIKSVVVSRHTCARVSRRLGLEEFMVLGKGLSSYPTIPQSVLSDVFESLVAAVHLDGGAEASRSFVMQHMLDEIRIAAETHHTSNYKSLLQQVAQKEYGSTPVYQVLDEKGPDHSKCFKVSAQVGRQRFPPAWGRNKKEAEQRAAQNALCAISGQPAPYPAD